MSPRVRRMIMALERAAEDIRWRRVPSKTSCSLRPLPGSVRVEVKNCGCAEERTHSPEAYCDDCLPLVAKVWMDVDDGSAEYVGPIYFSFRRFLFFNGRIMAEYYYEGG